MTMFTNGTAIKSSHKWSDMHWNTDFKNIKAQCVSKVNVEVGLFKSSWYKTGMF